MLETINLEPILDFLSKKFLFLVLIYQAICGNVFMNVAREDHSGLEKVADTLLIPSQYIFAGKIAYSPDPNHPNYRLKQRFSYKDHFALKATLSIIALPLSIPLGSLCKACAYLFTDYRNHHTKMVSSLCNYQICSHHSEYAKAGIQFHAPDELELFSPKELERRPGDETAMEEEKKALEAIGKLLSKHNIPWWVDCGTCLGVYRYGGVIPWDLDIDIAILAPDFLNALHALKKLDPDLYEVQDWSSRDLPDTYLKVLVKQTKTFIDIYHYRIRPDTGQIEYILSLENHMLLSESWKIRERRFKAPIEIAKVFPLKKAYFDSVEVFVPNDIEAYLQRFYGEDLSPAKVYNPITLQYEKDLNHPYWQRAFAH